MAAPKRRVSSEVDVPTASRKAAPKRRVSHEVDAPSGEPVDLDGHRGLLLVPEHARALYVLAHGAGAGMAHPFMDAMAGALAEQGIATLRWEFLYMSAGKGRPDPAAVAEASVRRVWEASAAHAAKAGGLPRVAGGKSFGGRMTSRAHAAAGLAGLRGLVFLGFPLHPPEKPGIERAEHLDQAAGPMLFLQGTRDELADLRLLRPVIARIGERATLHVIDGADHGLSRKGDVAELATTISDWIDRILDTA